MNRHRSLSRAILLCLAVITAGAGASVAPPVQAAAKGRPRLVVLLSVDQMRADYFALYGRQWRHGLARLFREGAVFTEARYPYLNTITCAGHSTIGTGAFPHRHGMILNSWWSRESGRGVECTEDPAAPAIFYGTPDPSPGHSPKPMGVPTLAEALKATLTPKPRVVSFSVKARSAIGLVGRGGDIVTWFDNRSWSSSKFFATAEYPVPHPVVTKVLAAHPDAKLVAKPWTKLGPARAYRFVDESPYERPSVPGWDRTFPHPLAVAPGTKVGNAEVSPLIAWAGSPFTDELLLAFAKGALTDLKLGRGAGTDMLAISFSALDSVGHPFGPRSHEVQDVLLRLDRVLGELLKALDRAVGKGRYVLALTSDHGVATYPEQLAAEGEDAGRIDMAGVKKALETSIAAELSPGNHVANVRYTDLYLAPGVYEGLRTRPGALDRVKAAVAKAKGGAAVFTSHELRDVAAVGDPARRPAALSHFPARSGDLILVPRKNWLTTSGSTTHGSSNDYDQRVPVLFFGAGIKRGRYDTASSPADVAPTLGALVGVQLPTAEGHVLESAFAGAGRKPRSPRR